MDRARLRNIFTARRYVSAGTRPNYGPMSVSVTSRCSISKRINESSWFSACELSSTYPTLCCKEIGISPKIIKGTSLWNFFPNSGHENFRHGISIVETCYQLSSRKVDAQSVINWTVIGQLRSQYLRAPTIDQYIVYHSNHQALSTTRFRRAGQLATVTIV